MMSRKPENIIDSDLFYSFVNIAGDDGPSFRFFIVPSNVVAEYVRASHEYWLRADPAHKDTSVREFRLALETDGYPLPTSPADQFENKWSVLEGGRS